MWRLSCLLRRSSFLTAERRREKERERGWMNNTFWTWATFSRMKSCVVLIFPCNFRLWHLVVHSPRRLNQTDRDPHQDPLLVSPDDTRFVILAWMNMFSVMTWCFCWHQMIFLLFFDSLLHKNTFFLFFPPSCYLIIEQTDQDSLTFQKVMNAPLHSSSSSYCSDPLQSAFFIVITSSIVYSLLLAINSTSSWPIFLWFNYNDYHEDSSGCYFWLLLTWLQPTTSSLTCRTFSHSCGFFVLFHHRSPWGSSESSDQHICHRNITISIFHDPRSGRKGSWSQGSHFNHQRDSFFGRPGSSIRRQRPVIGWIGCIQRLPRETCFSQWIL